jgi:WD40 repeat protein
MTFDARFERYALCDRRGNIRIRRVADNEELRRLQGPGAPAYVLRFSPDGRYLLARYPANPNYYLWDLGSGRVLWRKMSVGGSSFSPDSRFLALGTSGGFIAIYAVATGEEEKRFAWVRAPYTLAFDRGGRRLAAVCHERPRELRIYELAGGQMTAFHLPNPLMYAAGADELNWRADGEALAVVCQDHCVCILNPRTGKLQQRLSDPAWHPIQAVFNHRGDLIAAMSADKTLSLWDPLTGKRLIGLYASLGPQFSADDRWIGRFDGRRVEVLQVASGHAACEVLTVRVPPDGWGGVDFSLHRPLLAVACGGGVSLWDWTARKEVAFLPLGDTRSADGRFRPSRWRLTAVFDPRDGALLTCNSSEGLQRWPIVPDAESPADALCLGPPERIGKRNDFWLTRLSADGRTVAVADLHRGRALLFPRGTKADPVVLQPHANIDDVAISPDGQWAATGSWQEFASAIKVWDARAGKLVCELSLAGGDGGVTFSQDGRWLVTSAGLDFRFWHVGTWLPGPVLARDGSGGPSGSITFSADGALAAIAYSAQTVKLLDASTWQEVATLTAPEPRQIVQLRFSPDGRQLVVTCLGGEVQVWDVAHLRRHLAAMGLDWDSPPCPPPPEGRAAPLRLKILPGREAENVPKGGPRGAKGPR